MSVNPFFPSEKPRYRILMISNKRRIELDETKEGRYYLDQLFWNSKRLDMPSDQANYYFPVSDYGTNFLMNLRNEYSKRTRGID